MRGLLWLEVDEALNGHLHRASAQLAEPPKQHSKYAQRAYLAQVRCLVTLDVVWARQQGARPSVRVERAKSPKTPKASAEERTWTEAPFPLMGKSLDA